MVSVQSSKFKVQIPRGRPPLARADPRRLHSSPIPDPWRRDAL